MQKFQRGAKLLFKERLVNIITAARVREVLTTLPEGEQRLLQRRVRAEALLPGGDQPGGDMPGGDMPGGNMP